MKTILFPTDFSECANEAKKVAFSLAKLFNAQIRIIHIVSDTIFKWDSEKHFTDAIQTFPLYPNLSNVKVENKKNNVFLDSLIKLESECKNEGIKSSYNLIFGDVSDNILKEAKRVNADMIIMGTNGASGFKEAFIGSVTQKISRKSNRPVLSIRSVKNKTFKIDNIVYASDFKNESENNNLDRIKLLANYLNSKICLLYINTPHSFEDTHSCKQRIIKIATEYNLKNFKIEIYNHFTVEEGVLSFSKLNNIDLIAVSNHDYGIVRSLVEFRTTEILINHSKVPVLTLNS